MRNCKSMALFTVFSFGGFLSVAACCLGLFTFILQDRDVLAREYVAAAQSYYLQSEKLGIDEESRAYLLDVAQESMEKSLQLSRLQNAEHWSLLSKITRAQGKNNLSEKAYKIALTLDPSIAPSAAVHPEARKWKLLKISQYQNLKLDASYE